MDYSPYIIEENKLIAEFMGNRDLTLYHAKWQKGDDIIYLKYHTSWDWLMPVVEKIYNIPKGNPLIEDRLTVSLISADIKFTHELIIEFIKWYNEQKG